MNSNLASKTLVRAFLMGALALSATTLVSERNAHALSTFTVNTNNYDGAEWWGTINFTNNGPGATGSYKVEFDVPAGAHCTAESDSVPAGATLSPLTGDGSRTVSNHCVFTWTNSLLGVGANKTFNYSADSQHFDAASNVVVTDNSSTAVCSTFNVTKNTYDGSEWWGTLTFKNNGPFNSYNYKVEFDIPSGKHCTADAVPSGATLSPLTGSGSSARTVSNHCVFTWSNASPIYPNGSKTFNYSTDGQNFTKASNVQVSDASTCSGGACGGAGAACDVGNPLTCCSNLCNCIFTTCVCSAP